MGNALLFAIFAHLALPVNSGKMGQIDWAKVYIDDGLYISVHYCAWLVQGWEVAGCLTITNFAGHGVYVP